MELEQKIISIKGDKILFEIISNMAKIIEMQTIQYSLRNGEMIPIRTTENVLLKQLTDEYDTRLRALRITHGIEEYRGGATI